MEKIKLDKCRIEQKIDAEGKIYYSAWDEKYPSVVGGGDTQVEAINELKDNLEAFAEYLDDIYAGNANGVSTEE